VSFLEESYAFHQGSPSLTVTATTAAIKFAPVTLASYQDEQAGIEQRLPKTDHDAVRGEQQK
jgi:hypothetical protein